MANEPEWRQWSQNVKMELGWENAAIEPMMENALYFASKK